MINRELIKKPEVQEILWDYTEFLHKLGYTDSDFYTEEPYAVDRYVEEKEKYFNKLNKNNDKTRKAGDSN